MGETTLCHAFNYISWKKSLLDKNIKTTMAINGNYLNIVVCRNLRQAHFFEVGLMQIMANNKNLIHSMPCRTPCWLFIHEIFFGPLGLHLLVWSELGWSPPLRPMSALGLHWYRAFGLVCEVGPQCLGLNLWFHLLYLGPFYTWPGAGRSTGQIEASIGTHFMNFFPAQPCRM